MEKDTEVKRLRVVNAKAEGKPGKGYPEKYEKPETGSPENPENPDKPEKDIGKRLKIGGLLIFIFLLLYIPSLLNWLKGSNITSDILRIGTIEESSNTDSVLIRDEVLLEAPAFEGKYIPEAAEGEKVPAAGRVATVLNNTSDSLLKELDDINAKIIEARSKGAVKAEFFSEDTAKLDTQIGQKVQEVIALSNGNSLTAVEDIRTEIDKLMEKKSEIAGNAGNDKVIKPLLDQRMEIQNRISSNTKQITSAISGIISYMIDGNEQLLSPKSLESLTPKLLEGIKQDAGNLAASENSAHANKPVAKVIKGGQMYIAAVLSEALAKQYKPEEEISVRINDTGLLLPGTVTYISKPEEGKCVITVVTNRGLNELSSMRRVNADFIRSNDEGLKVPLKCLRNLSSDGSGADIMLIKANVAVLCRVVIESRDEEYAIIRSPDQEIKKTVNLYDTYILNPDNVKEGDIIDK